MLVVKTGMRAEYGIAQQWAAPDAIVLTGTQLVADLERHVPYTCEAIISFGLCGGLAPNVSVGQTFIYQTVVTPNGHTMTDYSWRNKLYRLTGYKEVECWSSGDWNTANDAAQRQELFEKTGCDVIDNETRWIAEFATERRISYMGLRVVSDGSEEDLPPAVADAINPDGTTNIMVVVESVTKNPNEIPSLVRTAFHYERSLILLNNAAKLIRPYFGWKQGIKSR